MPGERRAWLLDHTPHEFARITLTLLGFWCCLIAFWAIVWAIYVAWEDVLFVYLGIFSALVLGIIIALFLRRGDHHRKA